jgi:hypothetical protein
MWEMSCTGKFRATVSGPRQIHDGVRVQEPGTWLGIPPPARISS